MIHSECSGVETDVMLNTVEAVSTYYLLHLQSTPSNDIVRQMMGTLRDQPGSYITQNTVQLELASLSWPGCRGLLRSLLFLNPQLELFSFLNMSSSAPSDADSSDTSSCWASSHRRLYVTFSHVQQFYQRPANTLWCKKNKQHRCTDLSSTLGHRPCWQEVGIGAIKRPV